MWTLFDFSVYIHHDHYILFHDIVVFIVRNSEYYGHSVAFKLFQFFYLFFFLPLLYSIFSLTKFTPNLEGSDHHLLQVVLLCPVPIRKGMINPNMH